MNNVTIDTSWWQRSDLCYEEGNLLLSGQSLEHLGRSAGEPVFAYSARRLRANLDQLRQAIGSFPRDSRVLYAMKANRFLPVLAELRSAGVDGIDVCSPGEVRLARQAGFRENQISFTGTSVSNADLDVLVVHPDVWVNCDSLSSIRRLGEKCPGRRIGLRINPRIGVGYRQNEQLRYAGETATKFGIYEDQFEEALELAERCDLRITGLHLHAGCGYLDDQLPDFRRVLEAVVPFVERIPAIEHINLGGGLGIPLIEDDEQLDLEMWAGTVLETLGRFEVPIWIEPGDYLVKDAGVLVLEVNTIEEKCGQRFVGVNGGFNLHIEPAFYKLPLHVVPCRQASGDDGPDCIVAGNINESLDVFDLAAKLPGLSEGDFVAFLNAGGYGSSMSSNHCMRGSFYEYLIT